MQVLKMNHIKLTNYGNYAKITFSKPPLNVFNTEDLIYLEKILQELNRQKSLKLIIFESDQKVFSAGVDVADHLPEKIIPAMKAFNKLFGTLLELDIPTLSLVKSACFGGGSELALFCDFVLASENASFAQSEIKLGCFPPLSMGHLAYLTGCKKGLEIILTGESVNAAEALKIGLVNHVFSEEEFDQKADEFINSIISKSSSIIRATLSTYKKINYAGLKEKIEFAAKSFAQELPNLQDYHEGINSFFEKRSPSWKDC